MPAKHLLRTLRSSFLVIAFAMLAASACKQSNMSAKPSPAITDPAGACTADNHGYWSGSTCTCSTGWAIDTTTGRCTVQTSATAETGCTNSGGTWSGISCSCPSPMIWSDATYSCTTTAAAAPTQAQCTAAAATGAVWNGSACLCQNPSYPYWNPTSYQCVITAQTTTSTVGLVTQAQCTAAAATGAIWNGSACQCTSPAYPTWNAATYQCLASTLTGTGMAPATQTQCLAASATGAVWNGSACLCQSSSYPYWNPSVYQCVSAAQGTTSTVGSVTQTQCLSASSTGATWNGTACQCTSGSYPYWNAATLRCEVSVPTGATAINGQGLCSLGQLSIQGQCISMTSVSPQQGCEATAGRWSSGFPGTCTCSVGYVWYAALNSCQNFQASGTSATAAQQLCTLSGGQAGVTPGQCACPSTAQLKVDPSTNFQYCAANGAGEIPTWLRNILGLFF